MPNPRRIVAQTPPGNNGQPQDTEDVGDAYEPPTPSEDSPAGLDFDPADLEQPATPPAPDPFDPASLRLAGDLSTAMGVKKIQLSIKVRKPDKAEFVRVHPDPAYSLLTAVIELAGTRSETYLAHKSLWPDLAGEATFSPRLLFTAMTRQNVLFLWPCKLPPADGRDELDWGRTLREAATLAREKWVRVVANMAGGCYDVYTASGNLPDPEWPTETFPELLRVAFRDKFIDTPNHPVLRQLRGEL